MRKKVNISIKNNDEKKNFSTMGIINNGIVKYKDDEKITNIFDFDRQVLTRKNDIFEMNFVFLHEKMSYCTILTNKNNKIKEKISVKRIVKTDNSFEVEYTIYDDHHVEYKIEIIN